MSEKPPKPEEVIAIPDVLPAVALKDVVLFPYVMMQLSIGRPRSVAAVDTAAASDRIFLVLTQKDPSQEHPSPEDLYRVGTVVAITRMVKLPDGSMRILVQGVSRAAV
ncbi:MAG: LON peptidase substrate-binding domain-containing protein, partial [Thermoanaerobaculum sp.]|nr:LON peptidase substrate-binding domain-containing protein [Thermoanaerobaculum sp.]MDW7966745.1 LON peptidase substrate-binding domain-containing protein [Thermoanaerobaculum sp.]